MVLQLDTWERKLYTPGGGDPFLFYVLYGEIDLAASLSRSKYRSNGSPSGIHVMSYGPNKHPRVPASFRDGYHWNEFVSEAPELAASVAQCDRCIVVRGTPTDSANLDYLRDTVGLLTHFLDHGCCAIYDPLMFRWWQSLEWKETIFEPSAAVPHRHTVILVSEEEGAHPLKWFHTRGMQKFGRPDISVRDVPAELEDGVIELCDRLIEHQALGLVVPDGQVIRMASLPCGGVIRHSGDFDDPDFNNVHLEVRLQKTA